MQKKDYIIIVLSLVIIGLAVLIFTGNNNFETIIKSLQEQRISLVRSNQIIESELSRSIGEVTKLETDYIKLESDYTELESDNTELEQIIDNLTEGSRKTGNYLAEYGVINTDFAEFIQQAGITE